jgi:hypothetical protein
MTAKTFDRQTAKFLAVVSENMPEMNGALMQGWIENPKALQGALRGALCPLEATATPNKPKLRTWKTVKLGTYESLEGLSAALTSVGFEVSGPAADLLKKMTLAPNQAEIPLVNVSVRELGFEKGAILIQVFNRALECGLRLVPAEVGPQLRMKYPSQPDKAWLRVGMQPIADSEGYPSVFYLERVMGKLWLSTDYGHSSYFSNPDCRWVFAQPSADLV